MKIVKTAECCTILLSAGSPVRLKRAAKATTRVKSTTFPPTTSPKESSGMPLKADETPRNKFGMELAKDIIKKATTNSRQPKNLATPAKAPISHFPEKARAKQEKIKIKILKISIGHYMAKWLNG